MLRVILPAAAGIAAALSLLIDAEWAPLAFFCAMAVLAMSVRRFVSGDAVTLMTASGALWALSTVVHFFAPYVSVFPVVAATVISASGLILGVRTASDRKRQGRDEAASRAAAERGWRA